MAALLSQQIRFCRTRDGLQLAYATMGQGPVLVRAAHFLTHVEFDLQSPVWRPWLETLCRNRTLVRYDGRGCGLSDPPTTPLSLDSWVADLEAVVDAAGLERFALLGCSQGAAVSVAYAARHPERVKALVLLGGYARGLLHRQPTSEQLREAQLLLEMIEIGWGHENPAFRQAITSLYLPEGRPEQAQWFNELERLSTTPSHAARTLAAFGGIDVSEQAAQLRCPTLVLHARRDARVPFTEGRLMAGLIPAARFVPLDSANHVLLAHEAAFGHCFSEVHDFLALHDPAPVTTGAVFPALTPRERELLELLARGLDNLQIAAHLALSEKTVRNKVSAIFDKLGVDNRGRAIVLAREAGFGRADKPA